MKDLEKVLVMSEETWSAIKEIIFERASKHSDPIGYLGIMNGMEVITDNTLPFNAVEVYYKWVYEEIVKAEREKKKYDI